MSFSGVKTLSALSPLFILLSNQLSVSNGWSDTATLTTSSMTSNIASVSLVNHRDGDYNIINTGDSTFDCLNENCNSFCVELNIYNTQCSDGTETIEITLYGSGGDTGNPDLMALFSLQNSDNTIDYLSMANDWDNGGLGVGIGTIGGVFTAPQCSSASLLNYNEVDNDVVNGLFDGISSTGGSVLKKALGGGNSNNWEALTTEKVGPETSPVKYTIINDYNKNTLTTKFEADGLDSSTECIRDTPFDTNSGNDYIVAFGTDRDSIKFSQFDITVTCDPPTSSPSNIPTSNPSPMPSMAPSYAPTEACDYTHKCQSKGDPHITGFDGLLFHFQGEGYFDYVKSCDNSGLYLPFTISAKHYQCRETRTCLEEVIVELDDGDNTRILFPTNTEPTFLSNGNNAVGNSYSFTDSNGNLVEYDISKYEFEISFINNNGDKSSLKFYYKGKTLEIQTTDCLYGDNTLCGLCGNINYDNSDDFTRCDNGVIVDSTNTGSGYSGVFWQNTHIFGESCCNSELDIEYTGTSDCDPDIPPEISEECIEYAQTICEEFYYDYCTLCEADTPTTEWSEQCAFDMCADSTCETLVLNAEFSSIDEVIDAECLDFSIDECGDRYYQEMMDLFDKLGYEI